MRLLPIAIFTAAAALTLAIASAKADETPPAPGALFGFRCEGPDLRFTAQACAEKLKELCPAGIVLVQLRHTTKEATPAVFEGVAVCKGQAA